MLSTMRRSQGIGHPSILSRGLSFTLDRHVQREEEGVVRLLFSEVQVDRRPTRCGAAGNPRG